MLNLGGIFSSQTIAGRSLRWLLNLLPSNAYVPIVQGPARGYRWRIGSSVHSCWLGCYEADIVRAALLQLPPPGVAYDLGANAGYYTLVLTKRMHHVYAFEPVPLELTRHVEKNRLESRVTVVAAAVSDVTGDGWLTPGDAPERRLASTGALRVRTVALDEMDLPDPCFVKMDIEGSEAKALRGMRERLRRAHPVLLIAIHGDALRADVLQQLYEFSYRIAWVQPDTLLAT
jgi:FkbM family methyltransferase